MSDPAGVEGLFGGKRYRFEKILDAGKNQVVYRLICDEDQTRIAYGFPRKPCGAEMASAETVN
jgi:hypothetical protein